MKNQQWLLITVAALIIFAGCAERNTPLVSTEDYAFKLVSQTQTSGWAVDIAIAGDSAYVAEQEGGVTIWDISNPENLKIKDTLSTSGNAKMIEFDPITNLFFVNTSDNLGGIEFISYVDHHGIHEPKRSFGQVGSGTMYGMAYRQVSPDTVIVTGIDATDGLFIRTVYWDTQFNEWQPGYGSSWDVISLDYGKMRGLYYDNDRIYVANNQMGIAIINMNYGDETGGFDLTLLGSIDTPGAARAVGVNDEKTHVIVADWESGLVIIDVTDPANPEIASTILPEGVRRAIKLVVRNNVAYFLDQYDGMFAVDVNDPINPVLIGKYRTPEPTSIEVTDDYIFVTDENLGIIVLEWRNQP
ncbi:MAG: hypothetical protein HN356_03415 [Calditrichaeota bacterium]|jgi:hypothetical protein|nr:hypothetical protein [Calditrichota bacterium]MBT7790731.1 hypothetical protein [Calditrichota bacterium]